MKYKKYLKSLRKKAARFGISLIESSTNEINEDNLGGFMLIDIEAQKLMDGQRFELSPEDVENFLEELEFLCS